MPNYMKVNCFSTLAAVSMLCLGLATSCASAGVDKANSPQQAPGIAPAPATPASSATIAAEPAASGIFYTEGGVAIKGTDPVAYFQKGEPVRGKSEFSYKWGNAFWHFSSAENRDLFASNPQKYAPQYGGFCAWAVSQGYTAPIDPNAWKIVAGKLYLNFDKNIQKRWERDIPGNIAKADNNWPGVLNKK